MPRTLYQPEFRAEAVRLVRASGKTPEEIAADLGLFSESSSKWVRQSDMDAARRDGLASAVREELWRLRREVRVLREEREILKKSSMAPGATA